MEYDEKYSDELIDATYSEDSDEENQEDDLYGPGGDDDE
jgi:hypothetical protein